MSLKIRQLDRLLLLLNDSDTLDNRRGRPGEILYDWTNNTLRVYSAKPGDPDGGMALVKSDLSNVDPGATIVVGDAEVGSLKIQGSTITSTDSSTVNIEQSLGVTGSITALALTLDRGVTVSEFSIDRSMSDAADDAVPTERTVVEYMDTTIETRVFQAQSTAPEQPLLGSFWLDTTDHRLYHRQNPDYWVEIGGAAQVAILGDQAATPTSLAQRDSSGDIYAAGFVAIDSVTTPSLRSGTSISDQGFIEGQWSLVGGSTLTATYADLAEYHSSDQIWPPGTVLMINPEGLLTQSTEYAGTAVMGVVTTAPAYVLNDRCPEPRVCMALAGCVPVLALGPIKPGDLLTASSEPGIAQARAFPSMGTVIGKAMESLPENQQGLIKMLVLNR